MDNCSCFCHVRYKQLNSKVVSPQWTIVPVSAMSAINRFLCRVFTVFYFKCVCDKVMCQVTNEHIPFALLILSLILYQHCQDWVCLHDYTIIYNDYIVPEDFDDTDDKI